MDVTKGLTVAVLVVGACLLIWCTGGGSLREDMHSPGRAETPAQVAQVKQFILQGIAPPGGAGPLLQTLGAPKNFNKLTPNQQNNYWNMVWITILGKPELYPTLNRFALSIPHNAILGGVAMRIWQYMLLGRQIPRFYEKFDPPTVKKYNRMTAAQKIQNAQRLANTINNDWTDGLEFLCWLAAIHPGSILSEMDWNSTCVNYTQSGPVNPGGEQIGFSLP